MAAWLFVAQLATLVLLLALVYRPLGDYLARVFTTDKDLAVEWKADESPVETVDIMPTLAAMVGLPLVPASVDGKCLNGAAGTVCISR